MINNKGLSHNIPSQWNNEVKHRNEAVSGGVFFKNVRQNIDERDTRKSRNNH